VAISPGRNPGTRIPALAVVGSANVDLVMAVSRMPRPGDTVLAHHTRRLVGGKGANQAVAARRDGAAVCLLASVGDDDDGSAVRDRLAAEGIDIRGVRTSEGTATGLAVVAVGPVGENQILVAPGANDQFQTLSASDRQVLAQADLVLIQLEVPDSLVRETLHAARGRVVLNAAPARPVDKDDLALACAVVVNEHEAQEQRARLTAVQNLVITLGSRGAVLRRPGHRDLVVEGHPVPALDTTGAGDTFCGVLAVALASGADWPAVLARANVAAALSVQRVGAQDSMPTTSEIDRWLGEL
jgi:ribokinase